MIRTLPAQLVTAPPAGAPLTRTLQAMASPITLTVTEPGPHAPAALDRAEEIMRKVERACSRFDPASPLSRANAAPDCWHDVPATLAAAITEAERAHRETGGLFDPRVLTRLLSWGYDRSLPFASGSVARDVDRPSDRTADAADLPGSTPWRPEVRRDHGQWRVHLGPLPIDLGGIGKGLAARSAAAALAGAGRGYLVDAGGDCALGGVGADGGGWRIGVEDPAGGAEPVLVLELTDTGCATSSVRLRSWRANGEPVHHLIDPRTSRPGGSGLAAVTVVDPDPAWSEVLSKALFLGGAEGIGARADHLGLAAAWVGRDGALGTSAALDPLVIWRREDG